MNKHLKILERYIPDLERIAAVMNEYNASQNINETVTVERLLEETVSEMVCQYRKDLELAGALPVEYINGKRYYRDDRLGECRNCDDFTDVIKPSSVWD
jgi:hypothetical protein